jgi:hypothetical protein
LGVWTSFSMEEDSTPEGVSRPDVEDTGEGIRCLGLPQSQHALQGKDVRLTDIFGWYHG